MKTQRNFLIVLILALTTSISLQAKVNPDTGAMIIRIDNANNQSLSVQIANMQKQRTLISIVNMDGQRCFLEVVRKKNGFAKNFNLSNLPAGNYMVSIKSKIESYARLFEKSEKSITFFQTNEQYKNGDGQVILAGNKNAPGQSLITHFSKTDAQSVGVQLANLEGTKAEINLKFFSGAMVATDTVKGKNAYAKSFNLKGMSDGQYYMYIKTQGKTQVQFISIEDGKVVLGDQYVLAQNKEDTNLVAK